MGHGAVTFDAAGDADQTAADHRLAEGHVDALPEVLSQTCCRGAFRRPSRTDIEVSSYVGLPEIADIKVFPLDEAEAASQRDAFLTTWAALPKAGDVE
ncbi:hypothetical protein B6K69_17680 (plasmid) [Fuscovulum blasticum]|nr:hypothetical protein B6K69_17680 [Fuscovulum blasticum]